MNDSLIKTANRLDGLSGLNITIKKNENATFKIYADFSTSISTTTGSTYQLAINTGNITATNTNGA
jgi:hypothetical protein